jgi:hypothetical protein
MAGARAVGVAQAAEDGPKRSGSTLRGREGASAADGRIDGGTFRGASRGTTHRVESAVAGLAPRPGWSKVRMVYAEARKGIAPDLPETENRHVPGAQAVGADAGRRNLMARVFVFGRTTSGSRRGDRGSTAMSAPICVWRQRRSRDARQRRRQTGRRVGAKLRTRPTALPPYRPPTGAASLSPSPRPRAGGESSASVATGGPAAPLAARWTPEQVRGDGWCSWERPRPIQTDAVLHFATRATFVAALSHRRLASRRTLPQAPT